MKPLLLALGNDLMGDDAVGLVAARAMRQEMPEGWEVQEAAGNGLDLLDALEGREKVLLVDAVCTGKVPPGTILEFGVPDFRHLAAASPHTVGLPEVMALARELSLPFPSAMRILAMEVEPVMAVREGLSAVVAEALPRFLERTRAICASMAAAP